MWKNLSRAPKTSVCGICREMSITLREASEARLLETLERVDICTFFTYIYKVFITTAQHTGLA